jgi:sec-independent protein translocase protein TatC
MFAEHDREDDPFVATRMPLGDHIEELRRRLLRALAGLGVALVLGFYLSPEVLDFIKTPVENELARFQQRRQDRLAKLLTGGNPELTEANRPREIEILVPAARLRELLGLPRSEEAGWEPVRVRVRPLEWALLTGEASRLVGRPPTLVGFGAAEVFNVYFKVSLYAGLVLASPWIFWQLWVFVAAGLYPHERRRVYLFGPMSLGLFLGGVALCEFVVLPVSVRYLLSFYEWLGYEPDLRLSDWLGFALFLPLVFGLAFQTPLVMLFLDRVGIVDADVFRRNRRLAIFLLAFLAAVLTVTPDVVGMLSLAVPLWLLYEAGILLCRFSGQRPAGTTEEELVGFAAAADYPESAGPQ